MGFEAQDFFKNTPLGKSASEDHPQEACATNLTEVIIDEQKIKVFPQTDGTFTVYVANCIFTVNKSDGVPMIHNITPAEAHGAWQASKLEPLALQAVEENYFSD